MGLLENKTSEASIPLSNYNIEQVHFQLKPKSSGPHHYSLDYQFRSSNYRFHDIISSLLRNCRPGLIQCPQTKLAELLFARKPEK